MATIPELAKGQASAWHWATAAMLAGGAAAVLTVAIGAAALGAGAEPARVEVKDKTAFVAYLDGNREQRDVQEGDRFPVVRRTGSYYAGRPSSPLPA
jgi:hypothetical protein